jgi:hypothetical protein
MAYALLDMIGRKYPLGVKLQIGSDPGNQIVLLDPQVAPWHATLWEQQGILYLLDGSEGRATFVNQALVQGTVALRMGDQVGIGGTLFTVVDPNAQPAARTQAPKKRIGCMRWLLIGAGIAVAEFLLLAVAGFLIYRTDVEMRGGINDLLLLISPVPSTDGPPTDKDQPGPEILSLGDPWLTSSYYPANFTQNEEIMVETVSPAGAAVKMSFVRNSMQQPLPDWTSYSLVQQIMNDQVIAQVETGIVKGIAYSGTTTCNSYPDPKAGNRATDNRPQAILTTDLTGHVKRVETGVTINGVIADRYELRKDNFAATDTVVEFISGSLYRARDGGYLVQVDYVVKIKPQSWAINMGDDYSSTEPSLVTYHFDRVYAPDGTLTAKVPEVCADQVK